ncbi:MAG: sulfotransferase [Saprospiraceae bacterium]|nr:sulfotransferase [Saprospiraceae bacterium]
MPILIACSPSTGSSLLRRILNRHSKVYCGPETSLFAKKGLYEDWDNQKHNIFKRAFNGLPNLGWHHLIGVNLIEDTELTKENIIDLVNESNSFTSFIDSYYKAIFKIVNKEVWVEKTPSNAFAVSYFLDLFPDGKVIHIIRNPYDTIASLVNRGMSTYNATAVYLLNVSQVLNVRDKHKVMLVKYEDLVSNAQKCISNVCDFINVNFESTMLENSGNEKGIDHMDGWQYKETQAVGNKSVGRFEKLTSKQKNLMHTCIQNLRSQLETDCHSIENICNLLDYEFLSNNYQPTNLFWFKKDMIIDKVKRSFKNAFFKRKNYPLKWK